MIEIYEKAFEFFTDLISNNQIQFCTGNLEKKTKVVYISTMQCCLSVGVSPP